MRLCAHFIEYNDLISQAYGVMGDTGTAVRDAVFFRWHKFLDDTFVQHKVTLDPYTEEDLTFGGITVTSASIDDVDSNVQHKVTLDPYTEEDLFAPTLESIDDVDSKVSLHGFIVCNDK